MTNSSEVSRSGAERATFEKNPNRNFFWKNPATPKKYFLHLCSLTVIGLIQGWPHGTLNVGKWAVVLRASFAFEWLLAKSWMPVLPDAPLRITSSKTCVFEASGWMWFFALLAIYKRFAKSPMWAVSSLVELTYLLRICSDRGGRSVFWFGLTTTTGTFSFLYVIFFVFLHFIFFPLVIVLRDSRDRLRDCRVSPYFFFCFGGGLRARLFLIRHPKHNHDVWRTRAHHSGLSSKRNLADF